MKLLIVADPLAGLNLAGDSSLAMARAALARGHEVVWAEASQLSYGDFRPHVEGAGLVASGGEMPNRGEEVRCSVREFDGVLIRKDPPFDEGYLRMCWLLALEERSVYMMNRPSLLLRYHEKLLPLEGLASGMLEASDLVPTFIGGPRLGSGFLEREGVGEAVSKPLLGFAGRDVVKLPTSSLKRSEAWDPNRMVQPYLPEIVTKGDRRVLYLGGEVVGHFVRRPPKGGFISNLAQGGTAHREPMTAPQQALAERVGKFLKAIGVDFAGADFIDTKVSEINITSPTGLRSVETLEGTRPAARLIEHWERAVGKK